MRLIISLVLSPALVLTSSCSGGGPPRCNTMTCTQGCCDERDLCRAGTEAAACGSGGMLCVACPAAQQCEAGVCRMKAPCSASTCNGCCDATGACVAAPTTAACGAGGGMCVVCGAGQVCSGGGACIPDPDRCDASPQMVRTAQLHTMLLSAKCTSNCHAFGGVSDQYANYMSATSTQQVVNRASQYAGATATLKVVEPNNLANSSLWLKVSSTTMQGRRGPRGELTGARMPGDGSILSAAELKLIKDWICTGAQP